MMVRMVPSDMCCLRYRRGSDHSRQRSAKRRPSTKAAVKTANVAGSEDCGGAVGLKAGKGSLASVWSWPSGIDEDRARSAANARRRVPTPSAASPGPSTSRSPANAAKITKPQPTAAMIAAAANTAPRRSVARAQSPNLRAKACAEARYPGVTDASSPR
jgi:hypothetical protein